MVRTWISEGGHVLTLTVDDQRSAVWYLLRDDRTILSKRYEWWQCFQAVEEAENLAQAVGMREGDRAEA